MTTCTLRIEGMSCASCAYSVEDAVRALPGVTAASVVLSEGLLRVEGQGVAPADVERAVEESGYAIARSTTPMDREEARGRIRFAVAAFSAMNAMLPAAAVWASGAGEIDARTRWLLAAASAVLAVPALTWGAWPFYARAWRSWKRPGMDMLVSTGTLVTAGYSAVALGLGRSDVFFDTAAMLVAVLLAGRALETALRRRGGDAVRALMSLAPPTATRIQDGQTSEVPTDLVPVGARIRVRAGDRFSLDGRVVEGTSSVDRALLTGEWTPEPVGPGAWVEAGTRNLESNIDMVVERSHGARAIDGVVASVERLLASRAPIQGVADRLARWLAVAVLSAAAVTAMLVLVHHGAVADAALRAAAVVVVACPCALGLATPMALVVAAGTAAKRGMLFRDGAALERAAAVQRVFLDKTGTVTEGRPAIAGVDAAQASRHDVIAVAAAAERGLDHPVARAIAALSPDAILEGHREVVPGAGVRVTRPNGDVVVGSAAFLATAGVMVPTNGNAGTVAHVARAGVHLGSIRLHDEPRAGVRVAVAELARLGLRPHLVSGDRESAVRPLADELGASFDAERSPDEKARAVEAARRAGHVVAFVGDGVNDAPALAAADVGIAVGGATDGASALSAVVLRHGGAERIPEVLAFARRVRSVMRQNLAWAIGYNLVAIPVAAMGLASPALAAGLMTFSSVSVVVNSLRLIRA